MLNCEAKTTGACWSNHHPIVISGEMFVAQCVGESRVIDTEVVPANPLLGHTRSATSFENIEWSVGIGFWHPNIIGQVTKPFILKVWKLLAKIFEVGDFIDWVPILLFSPVQPKWAACFWRKVPLYDFRDMSVQLIRSLLNFLFVWHRVDQ